MPETTEQAELEMLRDAMRFTLTDCQRLLRESDVEHICPSRELCFEYSDRVRCGPCAIKQSEVYGVEPDHSLPFAPEQYRLKRQLRAAETEIGILNGALAGVLEAYRERGTAPDILRDAIEKVVDRYGEWTSKEFDPSQISITDDGRLEYAGIEVTHTSETADAITFVRRVDEWAMNNLTLLPGGRWRLRTL